MFLKKDQKKMRSFNLIFFLILVSNTCCNDNQEKNKTLHQCKVIECSNKPISSIHDEIRRERVFIIKTDCDFYYSSPTPLKIGDTIRIFK
jgi:hypothetical protein